jgi:hypothetical protein
MRHIITKTLLMIEVEQRILVNLEVVVQEEMVRTILLQAGQLLPCILVET